MPKTFRKLAGACARLEGWGRATRFALMPRDASQRIWAVEALALASRCDAPQHEGEGEPRILAKRSQGSFRRPVVPAKAGTHDHRRWLWVPALPSLSRGSAGTTAGSVSSTNLRLCEMAAGVISIVSD